MAGRLWGGIVSAGGVTPLRSLRRTRDLQIKPASDGIQEYQRGRTTREHRFRHLGRAIRPYAAGAVVSLTTRGEIEPAAAASPRVELLDVEAQPQSGTLRTEEGG